MLEDDAISRKHLSESIAEYYSISQAFVAKLGFLRFELTDAYRSRLTSESESRSNVLDEYVEELYSLLEKSPHIMEIKPTLKELKEDFKGGNFGITTWAYDKALSLGKFLSLRVVLPKRKRDDLGIYPWTWNPEEFELFFDGALFVAFAEIDSVPLATDLGQIAREFLTETLAPAKIWNHVCGIGPTPIHPEFYFLQAAPKSSETTHSMRLPLIQETRGDLVIVVSDNEPIDVITKPLLRDVRFALSDFYSQRVADRQYSDAVDALANLDQQLNVRVSKYFKQSSLGRLFSGQSRSIRQLIAEMHTALQQVSFAEKMARRKQEEASGSIAESTFLKGLSAYFDEHMRSDVMFDREAELNSMNFAAAETNNFAIVQATVLAALIGAVLGGLLTVVAK